MKKVPDVFHIGERVVQARADVPDTWLKQTERFVGTEMPQQHRDFFENLPMLFLALLDRTGRPWCVPAFGAPGFVVSPAPDRLALRGTPVLANELELERSTGASVGIVGVDLTNRRRNRMNGRVQDTSGGVMTIQVDQSFGNCPQYIQTRTLSAAQDEAKPTNRRRADLRDPEVRRIIEASDTFSSLPVRLVRLTVEVRVSMHRIVEAGPGFSVSMTTAPSPFRIFPAIAFSTRWVILKATAGSVCSFRISKQGARCY